MVEISLKTKAFVQQEGESFRKYLKGDGEYVDMYELSRYCDHLRRDSIVFFLVSSTAFTQLLGQVGVCTVLRLDLSFHLLHITPKAQFLAL